MWGRDSIWPENEGPKKWDLFVKARQNYKKCDRATCINTPSSPEQWTLTTHSFFLWREWWFSRSPLGATQFKHISWKNEEPSHFLAANTKKTYWIHILEFVFFQIHPLLYCPFLEDFLYGLVQPPPKKNNQHPSQSPGVFRASHVGNTMSCSEHPTRRNQCAWPDSWAKKVDIQIKRPKLTYKVGPGFSYKLVYNPYKWVTEVISLIINGVKIPLSRVVTSVTHLL